MAEDIDVPNVPGVPALPSYSPNAVQLLVADAVAIVGAIFGPQWGVFLDGQQAFPYRSVVDFDYKKDFPLSDYQQEDGAFQSYDKVELPFDVKVQLASGSTEFERAALIASVEAAAATLALFDVVTPERTYQSCNISHVGYKRQSHNGVGMVVMDVWFVEIRITSTSTFSNTQTPAVAGQQSTGNVAPVPSAGAVPAGSWQ